MSATAPHPAAIERAMSAALQLRQLMIGEDGTIADDDKLLLDMIEGQTDVLDVLDRVIEASMADAVLAELAAARAKRLKARQDWLRTTALQMLEALDITKPLERAAYTASIQRRAKAIVTDQALLPPSLLRIAPDMVALGKALRAGAVTGRGTHQPAAAHLVVEDTLMNAITTTAPPLAYGDLERLADSIAKSGLFGIKTKEQAIVLMMISHAEGRHPALAARDFDIINGRPAKKAEAMMRDFVQAGGKVEWHALTDELADATFTHPQTGSGAHRLGHEAGNDGLRQEGHVRQVPAPDAAQPRRVRRRSHALAAGHKRVSRPGGNGGHEA